jgi:hypothetical protein
MRRYKQRFIGVPLAALIESDTGKWVKYEDANKTMDNNANALFDVIKERNVEIKDLQSELQHTSDDLEDSKRRGFKLFTLLVISTALNLITVAVVTLTMMGKI